MPLPKICVLCAIPGLGGAEFSLLETVRHLRGSYEFHLIVPAEGPLSRSAEAAGAKVWILPWPNALSRTGETARRPSPAKIVRAAACLLPFTRQFSQLLEKIGPAAIITNAVKAHLIGALARKPKHVPLIWYMRDGLEDRFVSRTLLALMSRRCDVALCISEYVAAQFREHISQKVPSQVIYNIVDLERFHPGAAPAPDLPKKPEEVWFGMAGAITPLKGQDVFLRAAERVAAELPNAAFLIAGSNPYHTEAGLRYEEQLRRELPSSLAGRVRFVGFRHDMPGVLSRLDVLVQPNRGPEGLGRSVLEAMACAVPVVAVDRWGPAELVQHGETGLLFPPLDAETLAAHMLTLGKDPSLRTVMGKFGHEWIHTNLISNKLAGELDGLLTRTIACQLQEAAA